MVYWTRFGLEAAPWYSQRCLAMDGRSCVPGMRSHTRRVREPSMRPLLCPTSSGEPLAGALQVQRCARRASSSPEQPSEHTLAQLLSLQRLYAGRGPELAAPSTTADKDVEVSSDDGVSSKSFGDGLTADHFVVVDEVAPARHGSIHVLTVHDKAMLAFETPQLAPRRAIGTPSTIDDVEGEVRRVGGSQDRADEIGVTA